LIEQEITTKHYESYEIKTTLALLSLALGAGLSSQSLSQASEAALNRSVLPMPNTVRPDSVVHDMKSPDAKYPPIPQLRPPKGAPNVLIVLVDDAGFGSSSAFGGPCHEVPVWQTSPAGPFDAWPTGGGGFEYFYGFIAGEANHWYPTLFEGNTPVENKKTPEQGYHWVPDMTDKAIKWIGQQQALAPDKPFFIYYAPGATHAPHHGPKEWADKYKGKFDQGWDMLRQETFACQKKLQIIPADCQLTPRPKEVPSWDEMPEALKSVLRRQMEVNAGFMEYTDHQVGRLVETLDKLKILDNTLIYYIVGDNGASSEGTINGAYNEMANFNGLAPLETLEFLMARLDKLGGPESYNHYAVAWAHAMDTPYQWTKQVASHWGGTRNGTVVHWPKGIKARDEIRSRLAHVIDVVPTVLEAAGLPQPESVDGVQQDPIEGVSMAYSFDAPKAAERHETQYFEMFGNRAIYHKGWTAATKHRTPWVLIGAKNVPLDENVWELYSDQDWTQAMIFSADDGCDVGEDSGAPVSPDCGPVSNAYKERIEACSSRSRMIRTTTPSIPRTRSRRPWGGSESFVREPARCATCPRSRWRHERKSSSRRHRLETSTKTKDKQHMKKQNYLIIGLTALLVTSSQASQEQLARSIREARVETGRTSAQLKVTLGSLNALTAQTKGDLRPVYTTFCKEVANTESAAGWTRTRTQWMASDGRQYFKDWQNTVNGIANQSLREKAQKRMGNVQKSYDKVEASLGQAGEKFRPFLSDLGDIQKALASDVTPGGVKAIKGTVRSANWNHQFVDKAVKAALKEMDKMAKALSSEAQ